MRTVSPPGTWAYALRLPYDPRAARVARVTVRAALDGHGRHELVDDVELLVSELVTNAYRHAGGGCSLRITALRDGRVRVGVWDGHPHVPEASGKGRPCPRGTRTHPADAACTSYGSTRRRGVPGRRGRRCRGGAAPGSCCGSRWAPPRDRRDTALGPAGPGLDGAGVRQRARQTLTPKSWAMPTRPEA